MSKNTIPICVIFTGVHALEKHIRSYSDISSARSFSSKVPGKFDHKIYINIIDWME